MADEMAIKMAADTIMTVVVAAPFSPTILDDVTKVLEGLFRYTKDSTLESVDKRQRWEFWFEKFMEMRKPSSLDQAIRAINECAGLADRVINEWLLRNGDSIP